MLTSFFIFLATTFGFELNPEIVGMILLIPMICIGTEMVLMLTNFSIALPFSVLQKMEKQSMWVIVYLSECFIFLGTLMFYESKTEKMEYVSYMFYAFGLVILVAVIAIWWPDRKDQKLVSG